MKLNMGCGINKVAGWINVDKHGDPDVRHDLETFPWPWPDNSVEKVIFYHSLEHMGANPDTFIGIMKELYRVCADGALVEIDVPHHRHDNFHGDPTHVRVVTPEMIALFSKENCAKWAAAGNANSQLAVYHDVDFRMVSSKAILENPWAKQFEAGAIDDKTLQRDIRIYNNVVREMHMILTVVKE